MGPLGEQCNKCYFFEEDDSSKVFGLGVCMRFPPTTPPENDLRRPDEPEVGKHPWRPTVVHKERWCGEYKTGDQW
ncbi:MAG: hypothetical protein KJ804_12255 [Proteobacteria bacterium]|nr:hypothetical protein [Pseudomonadota bacterium]